MGLGSESKERSLFKGAFILTVAALITKILSAVYRVPFQNIVGDVGFYIYQQVYPLYGLALVLSTYGFPVVISKLYAEYEEMNDRQGIRDLLMISFFFLSIIGVIGFGGLYLGADWISMKMNDPHLATIIRIVAFVFLIMPITSVIRGYFQGRGNMVPTAVSQVVEQIIRVITILLVATIFVKKGYSLYDVGAGAMSGSITGGLISVLLLIMFLSRKRQSDHPIRFSVIMQVIKSSETKPIMKALFIQGLAMCVSGMLLLLLQLADSFNLYSLLVGSGMSEMEAKGWKGVYDRGQPLIQIGTVVATSMSLSLVPVISTEKLRGNSYFLKDYIRLSIEVSAVVGVGAAVGLACIMKPTNIMLFEDNAGENVLIVLSSLIFFNSVILTTTAILQGLGKVILPAIIIISGFGIKYGLNIYAISRFGTMGAAISSVLTMVIVMFILLLILSKTTGSSLSSTNFFVIIGLASGLMALFLNGYLFIVEQFLPVSHGHRFAAAFQSVTAVAIGGLLYLLVIIRGGIFKVEELSLLPFGSKLLALVRKRS